MTRRHYRKPSCRPVSWGRLSQEVRFRLAKFCLDISTYNLMRGIYGILRHRIPLGKQPPKREKELQRELTAKFFQDEHLTLGKVNAVTPTAFRFSDHPGFANLKYVSKREAIKRWGR